jgi:replicative DNA helicase
MNDRPLPRKPEIEQSVIAGMMQSDRFFWICLEKLIPEHFTIEIFRNLFKKFRDTKQHDQVMVEQFLNNNTESINSDGTDFSIADLLNTSYSVRGETETGILIEVYKRREGAVSCYNAINAYLSDDEQDPDEITSKLITTVSSLTIGPHNGYKRLSELIPAEIERQEAVCLKKSAAFIKTGFAAIDEKLCIINSDYIVIGAYPSNGKSTLANAIARNVARAGGVVLVFNLDTANSVEVSRAVFTEAKMDLNKFNLGFISKNDLPKIAGVFKPLSNLELYMDDNARPTPSQIAAKAQRLKATIGKINLVIVDYFQNTASDIKADARERYNHTSRSLHDLYKLTGCPTMVLSQMTRTKESDQRPTSNSLKETGNLYEDADKVILLHLPGHYKKYQPEDKEYNLLEVMITKNKNGPVGTIGLNIDESTMFISDRENKNYGQPSAFQNASGF